MPEDELMEVLRKHYPELVEATVKLRADIAEHRALEDAEKNKLAELCRSFDPSFKRDRTFEFVWYFTFGLFADGPEPTVLDFFYIARRITQLATRPELAARLSEIENKYDEQEEAEYEWHGEEFRDFAAKFVEPDAAIETIFEAIRQFYRFEDDVIWTYLTVWGLVCDISDPEYWRKHFVDTFPIFLDYYSGRDDEF